MACTASTAGSAPSAPIASVAKQPEAVAGERDQAAGGDHQRQQPAARVGEVEGEQDRRHDAPTESQRSAVQAARRLVQSSSADADPEHRAVGVPVAERVAQPRGRVAEALPTSSTCGSEAAGQAEQGDEGEGNRQAFSETLAPLVGLGDQECG